MSKRWLPSRAACRKVWAAIHERFGDQVEFQLFDRRRGLDQTQQKGGWQHVSELLSEGTYEHIKAPAPRRPQPTRRPPASSSPTPSPKPGDSRLSPATQGLLRRMVDNLNTHDPEAPNGAAPDALGTSPTDDAARTESAQARGIEAEQARLRDQGGGRTLRGRAAHVFTGKTPSGSNGSRTAWKLSSKISRRALSELENATTRFFGLPLAPGPLGTPHREASQDRLQTLQTRLRPPGGTPRTIPPSWPRKSCVTGNLTCPALGMRLAGSSGVGRRSNAANGRQHGRKIAAWIVARELEL